MPNIEKQVIFREFKCLIPNTTFGVFGLYRYPAKFIPRVVSYVFETYGRPKIRVVDPFAGSGTVGLVARLYGCNYEMWDLAPLLEVIHSVAITKPPKIDASNIVKQMIQCPTSWLPQWSNINYWYPECVLPLLSRLWGYYHSIEEDNIKRIIAIPLLRISKIFSYSDLQAQKLFKTKKSIQRVNNLLKAGWEERLITLLVKETSKVLVRLQEYHELMKRRGIEQESIRAIVKAGVDSLALSKDIQSSEWEILITSPPYLQAQEYIRSIKLDLFWLGHTEEEIRTLAKLELPYRTVTAVPIYSSTFEEWRNRIEEPDLRRIYENYFYGVIDTLTKISERVKERIFLFVGRASIRSQPVPIDKIFIEHWTTLGWKHEVTLIDQIHARTLAKAKINPATRTEAHRMEKEYLVVLRKTI
jgi:hypothetical protein